MQKTMFEVNMFARLELSRFNRLSNIEFELTNNHGKQKTKLERSGFSKCCIYETYPAEVNFRSNRPK